MKHIHPFPARMAPDIALSRLESLPPKSIVLDPMCGSGMVLSQSARVGLRSMGYDLDPLARLISRVGSTRVRESAVWECFDELKAYCLKNQKYQARLNWIDSDQETLDFIDYWFAPEQERQLRRIAKFLHAENPDFRSNVKNILVVALSRLIISKEPKASLARDTAHSRPHKTIETNDFDIHEHYENSIKHVLSALNSKEIKTNSTAYLGDARRLSRINDSTVDAIITSPPYLNAIDYMRGHKFSLIWFGYNLSYLRAIRSSAIGAETAVSSGNGREFDELMSTLKLKNINARTSSLLSRYYNDLRVQLGESKRVLKPRKKALYVIGNSSIRGEHIKNSEVLKFAAHKVGFKITDESIREIPNNKRYLPMSVGKENSLSQRMRTEHIIEMAA